MTPAEKCLRDGVAAGLTVRVEFEDEVDYEGADADKAWQAVRDCVEPMAVQFLREGEPHGKMWVIWQNGEDDLVDFTSGGWPAEWDAKRPTEI